MHYQSGHFDTTSTNSGVIGNPDGYGICNGFEVSVCLDWQQASLGVIDTCAMGPSPPRGLRIDASSADHVTSSLPTPLPERGMRLGRGRLLSGRGSGNLT
ncbi:hypothetical protein CDAR_603541 [Caerostris darwini]|uniref:DUF362 domain-containing protein n=1 Tax=Caerostris darwini TaxID=1538125 RepID=A0AAV4T7F6_9ARAC|nr:hypothetical protein CDAR_603541 [Caerostris darwini]